MSVMDIHPKEETPRVIRTHQARVNEGYRGDVDIRILRKDGSIFVCQRHREPACLPGTPVHSGILS